MRLSVVSLLGLGLWAFACGSTKKPPKTDGSCESCGGSGGTDGSDGSSGTGEVPITCAPNQRHCVGDEVWLCGTDGASATVYDTCSADEACDEAMVLCLPLVCEPGEAGCLGTQLAECNPQGTAFMLAPQGCAAELVCQEGECVERSCRPSEMSCVDGDVYQCDQAGLADVLLQACGPSTHCVEIPPAGQVVAQAYCLQNSCLAGEKVCAGNLLKECTEDGLLPDDGVDCDDEVCVNGACVPKLCEPTKLLCQDGDVHECAYPGASTNLLYACEEGSRCVEIVSGAGCGPIPCEAGATVCFGNAVGKCATDGEGLSQVTENCATAQQVCSVTPSCAASAVDTLGMAENVDTFSSNEVLGDIIDVHSDRLLTKLEANLILDAARDLRWVVYEMKEDGTYDLRASEITANNNGSAFFSSNELSWELEAGKRYLLGVSLVLFDGYLYYDEAPYQAEGRLSFGNAVSGARGGYGPNLTFQHNAPLYRIRATTELP